MRKVVLLLASVLASATTAFAHGNLDHILGTVTKLEGDVVSVEKSGKTTDVRLVRLTKYEESGHAGVRENLRVGDRVVIHAMKMMEQEQAQSVRFVHP